MAIQIQTGARLHFGPLSYHPESGRHFGGIGMMIDAPGVKLRADSSPGSRDDIPEVLLPLVSALRDRQVLVPESVRISLLEAIPEHCGLGSRTQLALAATEALTRLRGSVSTAAELAPLAGRGERSAIGIFGYAEGGFLIDAGHLPGAPLGELAARVPVPESWRVLLILPRGIPGLHGAAERQAFSRLSPMPEPVSGRLCRLALTEILPALQAGAFDRFAAALDEYGSVVGDFFAPLQGGRFASPLIRELVPLLQQHGIQGMAQSSWGPSLALLAPDETERERIRDLVGTLHLPGSLRLLAASPRNAGRSCNRTD